jgi:hypothetical protein
MAQNGRVGTLCGQANTSRPYRRISRPSTMPLEPSRMPVAASKRKSSNVLGNQRRSYRVYQSKEKAAKIKAISAVPFGAYQPPEGSVELSIHPPILTNRLKGSLRVDTETPTSSSALA